MVATRKASSKVIQWAAEQVPELVGGSADLAPSTLTPIEDGGDVQPRRRTPAATSTSASASTAWARSSTASTCTTSAPSARTFLIFTDYMKGAIRLAALMGIPSIFVFTHDSIGLGEDGPTHQPVEQLAQLRAMPQPQRRAPGRRQRDRAGPGASRSPRPTRRPCSRCSRQGVPTWNPAGVPDDAIERGAYVLRESYKDPEPDVILMASGSEMHMCNGAADLLEADGIAARVVSACPAWTRSRRRTRTTATACCRRPAAPAWPSRRRAR